MTRTVEYLEERITQMLDDIGICGQDAWLIGSVLIENRRASDVDLVLYLGKARGILESTAAKLRLLKRRFLVEFGIPLHLTAFCDVEHRELQEFLAWSGMNRRMRVGREDRQNG
jgi:hypothetical protein